MTFLDLVTIVVRDYDPAIRFFVDILGFQLIEDSPSLTNDGRAKRWVVVRPPGAQSGLLLARADGERQEAIIGEQHAGRVGFFLRVEDFDAHYARMTAAGVKFIRPPRAEAYGRVAVFEDIAGNRWDLLGPRPATQQYFHGTKADLKRGDLIAAGYDSNYGERKKAAWVYLSATLDAAIWGAELAAGEGRGRIYVVEPTGPIMDDPNLTDKKFPGNPTKSYRTREPLRVTGEITDWEGHPPDRLKAMRDHLERLKEQDVEAIED